MDNVARERLKELIGRHGYALIDEPGRMRSLLSDAAGEYKLEIRLIVGALGEGVPQELLDSTGGAIPAELLVARLEKRLCESLGLAKAAAGWAVESWAVALGVAAIVEDDRRFADRPAKDADRTRTMWARPRTLIVALDGTGEYSTMEEAVLMASPGSVIQLRSGVFPLSVPLQINKTMALIGESSDHTRIVCDGEEFVIRFIGDGLFRAEHVWFEHWGSRWASVMEATDGEVELRECKFSGAKHDPESQRGGSGVRIVGHAKASVSRCEALDNELHGVSIGERANATLVDNSCHDNKYYGIKFWNNSDGLAQRNVCNSNDCGIVADDEATPTVTSNTCNDNEKHGIFIAANARPKLIKNTCSSNNDAGIWCEYTSSGSVSENNCLHNNDGILLRDEAAPDVTLNLCQENTRDGIAYYGEAGGTCDKNLCVKNGENGIYIESTAQTALGTYECRDNKGGDLRDDRE